MDFPDATTPKATNPWRRAAWAAAVVALLAYLEILGLSVGAVAGGSDSSGYLNHARLISAGTVHAQPRVLAGIPFAEAPPYMYVPLGFNPAHDGSGLVPTYPMGLSLFIVAFKVVFGWRHAGDVVMLLHAAAGVIATYWLARLLDLSRPWSALCAVAVALSPLYLFMSQQAMSDVPSLAWTAFAVIAALRSRERPSLAIAAGFALSIDVLLRPTNVLALFPVLLAMGLSPRRWAYLALGGLPGAVAFCAQSHAAYGSVFATGYGNNSDSFSTGLIPGTLLHYVRWLPVLFTPLAVLVVGTPFLPRENKGAGLLLSSWIVAYAVFYSFYQYTHETWWYLRFLLPAAPALVIGAALVVRMLLSRWPAGRATAASPVAFVVALGLIAGNSIWWSTTLGAMQGGEEELRYGVLTDWMRANLPRDSVCLTMQASGSIYFYTTFTVLRWDMMDKASALKVRAALTESKRPLYAVLFPFEVDRIQDLEKTMQGEWKAVGKVDNVTIYQRLDAPAGT